MWKFGVILALAILRVKSLTEHEWSSLGDPRIYVEPTGKSPAETRIIGGTESTPNSVPYQAALFIQFEHGKSFCGGSLISENYVLTAAHCMDNEGKETKQTETQTGPFTELHHALGDFWRQILQAQSVEVLLGAHDIRKNENSQRRVTCKEIIVHPDWNYQKLQNDIALIKLPQSVSLNKYITTVNLANRGTFADSEALLTGWGKTSDTSKGSTVLNEVNLAVLENSECGNFYDEMIQFTHICTSGAEIKGGCNGDSGGPLVVDEQQIGIVSFGSNRCTKGFPTVFTRVTEYNDWISNHSDVKIK